MIYPKGYEWLGKIGPLPKVITEALSHYGTIETLGAKNNPTILAWADETGLRGQGYSADSVPWCGLFVAMAVKRAGYGFPKYPLWALNWLGFGSVAHQPCLGDVLVFLRDSGGHVGFYIGEDASRYYVLGGNQGDSVSIAPVLKKRLQGARSPIYKIARPASSKPYILKPTGALSVNEA